MIKLNLVVTPGTCNLLLASLAETQMQVGVVMQQIATKLKKHKPLRNLMKTITFSPFTTEEVNILLAGLGELPAKLSVALLLRLKKEGDAQMTEQPIKEVLDKED